MQQFKHFYVLFFLLSFQIYVYSQPSKKANNWFFGFNAGLNFTSSPAVPNLNGQLNSTEACTSISDEQGNLIFYSDGITVWGSDHNIISNGSGLNGSPTASQGALIVQVPQSDTLYYLFSKEGGDGDLFYSVIDIDTNGLNGSVIQKNIFLHSSLTEKLCAVKHCNNEDVWLTAVESERSAFLSFLITSNGIQSPISTTLYSAGVPLTGCMKFSPDGNFLAYVGANDVGVLRFNNSTGKLYGCGEISDSMFTSDSYGVEFSSNSEFLYFNMGSSIYQLKLNGLKESLFDTIVRVGQNLGSGLQMSSDEKIYISNVDTVISVIEFPNIPAPGCSYQSRSLDLNGRSAALGFPSFVASYFNENRTQVCVEGKCLHEVINFDYNTDLTLDSVIWKIYNSSSIILESSNQQTISYSFNKAGAYLILLECYSGGNIIEAIKKYLFFEQGPEIKPLFIDSPLCDDSIKVAFDPACLEGEISWSDNSTLDHLIVKQPGSYSISITNECYSDIGSFEIRKCPEDTIEVINVFTPNNDGMNDRFVLSLPLNVQGFNLMIYNRWGQRLFSTDDPLIGWDGLFDNTDVPAGVYYYTYFYSADSRNKNGAGFFMLVR